MSLFREYNFVFRKATLADAEMVLIWRNAEINRRYSLDKKIIGREEHMTWFTMVLNNDKIFLLIVEDGTGPIGVIRYDVPDGTARVSIYLKPGETGRGLGSAILRYGCEWLQQHVPVVNFIEAQISPDNIASIKAFMKAGFKPSYLVYKKSIKRLETMNG